MPELPDGEFGQALPDEPDWYGGMVPTGRAGDELGPKPGYHYSKYGTLVMVCPRCRLRHNREYVPALYLGETFYCCRCPEEPLVPITVAQARREWLAWKEEHRASMGAGEGDVHEYAANLLRGVLENLTDA